MITDTGTSTHLSGTKALATLPSLETGRPTAAGAAVTGREVTVAAAVGPADTRKCFTGHRGRTVRGLPGEEGHVQ